LGVRTIWLVPGPSYHTCGNIKGKEKISQKRKGKKEGKGNFMRFICTVILLIIRKSRKSPKTLHYTYMISWAVSIKKY